MPIIRRTRPAALDPTEPVVQAAAAVRTSSDYVAQCLENIKNESGRNAKKELLCMLRDESDIALKVMMAVFDVNVTYGIKSIPKPRTFAGKPAFKGEFNETTWTLLDCLANRSLTGNAAKEAIAGELGRLTLPSRGLLIAVLQQNLRAGFSGDVVNEVWGPVLRIVKIQLANNFFMKLKAGEKGPRKINPKARFPAFHDIKYDGVRGLYLSDETTGFFSRAGLPLECPPALLTLVAKFLADAKKFYECADGEELLLDCEIVPLNGGFSDIMSQVRASKRGASDGTTGIRIIDIITKQEYLEGKSYDNQRARRADLELMIEQPWFKNYAAFIKLTEGKEIQDEAQALEFYAETVAGGGEGTMHKHYDDYWEARRSDGWLKLKPAEEAEGVICGYKDGAKHSKWEGHLGAVLVKLPNKVVVSVDGMTDAVREYIHTHREELLGEPAELLCHEVTPDGSLRHPRFKPGFVRDDK